MARVEELSPDEKATLAEIDRVLRVSLEVEPSPEFLARVRGRINEERTSRVSWRVVAATLAAIVAALPRPSPVGPARTPGADSRPAVATTALMAPQEAAIEMATPTSTSSATRTDAKRASHRREREVLVDPRAGQALAEYAAALRAQKGAIAGSLEARVAAMDEWPRYQGVPLESTAATEDLPRISVLEELPRFERNDS
jgi:hypothetical protein